MGRIIDLEIGDKVYTLEFSRRTLLSCSDLIEEAKTAKTLTENYKVFIKLVHAALLKNHPDITEKEVEAIVDSIDDLEGFSGALNEIVENSVQTLKDNKGNAHWVVK